MNAKFMIFALVAVTMVAASTASFSNVVRNTACADFNFGLGSACDCPIVSLGNVTDSPLSLTYVANTAIAAGVDVTRFEGDKIYVRYNSSLKYFNHTQRFGDNENENCTNAFVWSLQKDSEETKCGTVSYVGVATWTNKLVADCKFARSIVEGTKIQYTFDFRVTVLEKIPFTSTGAVGGACRANACTTIRTITYKMPFIFKFQTEIEVTSSPVDVFAPILVVAAITDQEVLGVDPLAVPTMKTVLRTTVQYPFAITAKGTNGTTSYNSPPTSVLAPSRSDLEVKSLNVAVGQCLLTATSGLCIQDWTAVIGHKAGSSGTDLCTFDDVYTFDFNFFCVNARLNSCPLAGESTSAAIGAGSLAVGQLSWNLKSGDSCAVVAENIQLTTWIESFGTLAARTAALTKPANAGDAGQKDDFLDGQVIYFRIAAKTTEASIDYMIIKNLKYTKFVSGVAAGDVTLVADFVANAKSRVFSLSRGVGTRAGPGAFSYLDFNLTVVTGPAGFNFDQDEISDYTFTVLVAVQYVNGGQTPVSNLDQAVDADGFQTLTVRGSIAELSAGQADGSVAKSVAITGSASTTSSASTSKSNSATSTGLIAGLSAFVALVAVVAGVMVVSANRRASAAKAQFERTQSSAGLTGTGATNAHMSMTDLSVQQVKVSYDAIDE